MAVALAPVSPSPCSWTGRRGRCSPQRAPTRTGPTLTFALIGDISGAVASTTVRYLTPSDPSVVVGPPAAYHAPVRQHVPPVEPRVPVLVATPPRVVPGGRVSLWGTDFPPH